MKKAIMMIALVPLLASAPASAGNCHKDHSGHKHPAAAEKKPAADKKTEAVYRKVTKAEIGKSAVCPVTGEELKIIENTVSMSYKGKNYYFCCPGCDKSFMKAPEKYAVKEKAAARKYACPMACAESDKPGRCPKCGMDMKERKQPAGPAKKR